jgi:hypothetical protein
VIFRVVSWIALTWLPDTEASKLGPSIHVREKLHIYLMLSLMLTWFACAALQLKAAAPHHLIGRPNKG